MARIVSFVCLVLCLHWVRSEVSSTETTTLPVATLPVQDICTVCGCRDKQIRCAPPAKMTSLLNVRVPGNYNVLDLSSNHLRSIDQDSFYNAPDITELNLAYNQITYIAQKSFKQFRNLTSLCLTHNGLVTLNDDSFEGLRKLEKLDLSDNRFRRINPEYLMHLVNLKYLILDGNTLEGFHGSIFRNNTKLNQLFLNKNGISTLDDDIFQYTRDLRVLHLEDNFIEIIPKVALSKLPLLEFLSLSGNPIHVISAMSFPKLPNLQQIIMISMYNLAVIEVYAFIDLPMLRHVKIQHCTNLIFIDPLAFNLDMNSERKPKYPPMKHFILRDTSVSTLSPKLLDWNSVEDLDISGNPFHCNCNLSWMVDLVRNHDVNEDIKCHTPDALSDHIIGRLQPEKMKCDNYDPVKEAEEEGNEPFRQLSGSLSSSEKSFSMMHFAIVLMLSVTIVLSILLIMSLKRRGFLYKKLGKSTPMPNTSGENVLYMRTTIDNY